MQEKNCGYDPSQIGMAAPIAALPPTMKNARPASRILEANLLGSLVMPETKRSLILIAVLTNIEASQFPAFNRE